MAIVTRILFSLCSPCGVVSSDLPVRLKTHNSELKTARAGAQTNPSSKPGYQGRQPLPSELWNATRERIPQSVDKRCRRSHGRVERLAMDGPLVSRYLTLHL